MVKIAIVTGGDNTEREISLISANAVREGLKHVGGYELLWFDLPADLDRLHTDGKAGAIDFVFLMIHGIGGEDGQIAGLLDMYAIPYHCATRDVLALTMNKRWTKCVWRQCGIPVADDVLIQPKFESKQSIIDKVMKGVGCPCVWKELDQGSSHGVHIIYTVDNLTQIIDQYADFSGPILVEAFIEGEEITVPILEQLDGTTKALPLIHIIPPEEGGFDYENKYNGKTQEVCPSDFDVSITTLVEDLALQAYYAVQCSKYARVDAILTNKGPVFLELNTIPGFTAESLYPKSAKVAGLDFSQLLQHLIDLSLR